MKELQTTIESSYYKHREQCYDAQANDLDEYIVITTKGKSIMVDVLVN